VRKASFTKKQLNGMFQFAIAMAQRAADNANLPQTVYSFKHEEFPFHSFAASDAEFDLAMCERNKYTPLFTVLPQKWLMEY